MNVVDMDDPNCVRDPHVKSTFDAELHRLDNEKKKTMKKLNNILEVNLLKSYGSDYSIVLFCALFLKSINSSLIVFLRFILPLDGRLCFIFFGEGGEHCYPFFSCLSVSQDSASLQMNISLSKIWSKINYLQKMSIFHE